MTIKRRTFLAGLIAAPAIVQASTIMPIWVPRHVATSDGIIRVTAGNRLMTVDEVAWEVFGMFSDEITGHKSPQIHPRFSVDRLQASKNAR